jgi:hypothetical protein
MATDFPAGCRHKTRGKFPLAWDPVHEDQ